MMTEHRPSTDPTGQTDPPSEHALGAATGGLIGASFGLVFVIVNSAGLAAATRITTITAAVALALVVAVLAVRAFRLAARSTARAHAAGSTSGTSSSADRRRALPFGRAYWIVVAIEVVAIVVGARLLSGPLGLPELGVAWVAVVVGTHFFALARVFRLRRFHLLAAVVTACGLAGFALAWAGRMDAVAIVSGVLSGFVLLAFAVWGLLSLRRAPTA